MQSIGEWREDSGLSGSTSSRASPKPCKSSYSISFRRMQRSEARFPSLSALTAPITSRGLERSSTSISHRSCQYGQISSARLNNDLRIPRNCSGPHAARRRSTDTTSELPQFSADSTLSGRFSSIKRGHPRKTKHNHRKSGKKHERHCSPSLEFDADDERLTFCHAAPDSQLGRHCDVESVSWMEKDYLSSGTFGDIYKGRLHEAVVCVKVIRPLQIQGDDVKKLKAAFFRESLIWRRLSHPNILSFYGCCRTYARPTFVSPWMENGDVNAYLVKKPDVDRYRLISDVLKGIRHLHSKGIIHGNLKGANVLVDHCGQAKVADYGIPALVHSTIDNWGATATTDPKNGTHRWEAPELFAGDCGQIEPRSEKSDVYAWACVCYEIFMGKLPFFEAKTNEAVVLRVIIRRATPSRPSSDSYAWHRWGLVEEFWEVMMMCWSRAPAFRPTIEELLNRLSTLSLVKDRQEMDVRN